MTNLDSAGARLKWARLRANYPDAAQFARAARVNPTTYRAYENDQNGFAKQAATFARKLGVTAEWLLDGGPLPTGPIPEVQPDIPPTRSADAGETVEIEQLDLSLSMGPGTIIDDYVEAERRTFDLAFIRSITRSPPHRLKIVTGIGRSMEPMLQDGDIIMIDTTDNQLSRDDGIYWYTLYEASGLKQLQPMGNGRVLLRAHNRDFGDREVAAEDLRIEGRAIWAARGL